MDIKEKNITTEKDMLNLLDVCYEKALKGIPKVSVSIKDLAKDYLNKEKDNKKAAEALIKNQILKCATSGFITGFGGVITLPVTLPANITSVLYVQIRMIASVAYLAGYDLTSDQVKTFVYACLAGISIDNVLKKAGVKFGNKLAVNSINKIPGKTLTKINQKVGMRFITKFGQKGVINLGKMVPVVGAGISASFDYLETKVIAKRAFKMFFSKNI